MKTNRLTALVIICLFSVTFLTSCSETKKDSATETAGVAANTEFDLVILNGRVMDPETNFDDIRNVGIIDGRIALITEEAISGKESIDATGKIVAPGFIDTHFHWGMPLGYSLGLRDGLTSSMDLETGVAGTYLSRWYEAREGVTQANYGIAVSHEQARAIAIDGAEGENLMNGSAALFETRKASGWSMTRATEKTGNEILQIIDKGLQDGAIGIGSTLGYMRDGVSTREMFEVQKLGASYGRLTAVHTRFTPDNDIMENVGSMEIIANAVALNSPAIVQHFNNPGWRLAHELVTRLQEQGFNIWGEVYPYAAGSTLLNAVYLSPENWVEKLGNTYETTLMDPETNEFYTLEKYKADIASNPTKTIILYKMPEEECPKWLTLKGTTMGSDAVGADPIFGPWDFPLDSLGATHPRTSGARGRTLRFGREYNIPLMQLISILSYNAAKHLGETGLKFFQERGRIQIGMVADIVVFDPETVTDNSDYNNGSVPTTGMKAVIVNGTITVSDDTLLPVFAGQPIRFEPEAKGRFEPVSEDAWTKSFTTGAPDFCGLKAHEH